MPFSLYMNHAHHCHEMLQVSHCTSSHKMPLSLHIMHITRDATLTAHHALEMPQSSVSDSRTAHRAHHTNPHIEMPLLSTLSTAHHTRYRTHSHKMPLSLHVTGHLTITTHRCTSHEMPLSLRRHSGYIMHISLNRTVVHKPFSFRKVRYAQAHKRTQPCFSLVGHFAGHGQARRACVCTQGCTVTLSRQHCHITTRSVEAQRAVRARMFRCRLTCRCDSAQIRQEASQGECRCPQAKETSRVQTQLASLARFFAAPQRLAVVERSAPSPFLCTTI